MLLLTLQFIYKMDFSTYFTDVVQEEMHIWHSDRSANGEVRPKQLELSNSLEVCIGYVLKCHC